MLNIRLANIQDMKNVFDLSNDDTVRRNSIHSEKIDWNNHVKWFTNKIDSAESIFYTAEDDSVFVGYCRLDKENDIWIVTIHISPAMRGKGYGTKIIREVCKSNTEKHLVSFVKESNDPSYKMFLHCNFKLIANVQIDNETYFKLQYSAEMI